MPASYGLSTCAWVHRIGSFRLARIRSIKPEFPQSESMGAISRDARLLFCLLWTVCDDEGRTRGASRMLASLLFPYDDDAPRLIDGWLSELESVQCIVRYSVAGSTYLQVCNWLIHQKIDKPSKSRLPAFVESSRILAKGREASAPDLGPRILDLGALDQKQQQSLPPKAAEADVGSDDDLSIEVVDQAGADAAEAGQAELPLPPSEDPPPADPPAPPIPKQSIGTRLHAEWKPSSESLEWALAKFPHVDTAAATDAFCDYWCALPGAKGRKLDWDATWKNRIRDIASRQGARAPPVKTNGIAAKFDSKTYSGGATDDELEAIFGRV